MIENENVWHALSELDTNALFLVDTRGIIRNINKGVTTLFGYSTHEIVGNPVELLFPPDIRKLHGSLFSNYVRLRQEEQQCKSKIVGDQRIFPDTISLQGSEPKRFTAINSHQQEIPITLTINEIGSDPDGLIGFIAIIRDNTEQYNLQQTLQYQARYDKLTGLINWQELVRQAHKVKKEMLDKSVDYHASILYLDIDYFKSITYQSQSTGDYAIKKVATWLLNKTRQSQDRGIDRVVSHFMGDEFILYLPDTSIEGALALAKRLKSDFLRLNLQTAEHPFFSSVSIGIASVNPTTKLQYAVSQASNACRFAKEKGRDKIKVAREDDAYHMELGAVIREALQNERLTLYAQTIVALSPGAKSIDNDRAHYEILSRIEDKGGNIISPALFIPAAEKLGLAIAIDMYVIEHTLAILKKHPDHTKTLSLCSINLSGASASNERMLRFIENQLHKSGIDPRKLCFEVTETFEILDNDTAMILVGNLREAGCQFAFDDFGIGYSNYQSFSRLPMDIIKIDGSYIRHILKDNRLRTDVEGMINSAKSRGLGIVGEYAENEAIVGELTRLGADYAQGFHFSKPVPLETLIAAPVETHRS
jgi:diguanylate cyclase (GGDEF)-like protein/PAS domain S-box-containing protein